MEPCCWQPQDDETFLLVELEPTLFALAAMGGKGGWFLEAYGTREQCEQKANDTASWVPVSATRETLYDGSVSVQLDDSNGFGLWFKSGGGVWSCEEVSHCGCGAVLGGSPKCSGCGRKVS